MSLKTEIEERKQRLASAQEEVKLLKKSIRKLEAVEELDLDLDGEAG